MGWSLGTRRTYSAILVLSVFMVFALAACSSGETVVVVQSDSGSGSTAVETSNADVSLGDISCGIVSNAEITSIVGVGNADQAVVATGSVVGDNLHCGWSSGGSRDIPGHSNLGISDALVNVIMMPISAPETMENHKLVEGFSLDNDPNGTFPEYGEGAFQTGFGALMRISGDYVIEVSVILDRTAGDLEAAKTLSELVDSRLVE
jgi:hypothetical protein